MDNFSWVGGSEPYASDYSADCFREQVRVFNLLPGQPAWTLVGNKTHPLLPRYNFPNRTFDLDLSGKNIDGSVIAEIVEAFAEAGVMLRSLDISENPLLTSTDVQRILAALPVEIQSLDMSQDYNGISSQFPASSLLGMERLTGLTYLRLNDDGLDPRNNEVIGLVMKNLHHIQSLFLSYVSTNMTLVAQALNPALRILDLGNTDFSSSEAQIALGNALAQNITLEELYLSSTQIGTSAEGNLALAKGLLKQSKLKVLNLNANEIGALPNVNVSTLLASLPSSITSLDVGGNYIGSTDSSESSAFAQAVKKMEGLTTLNAYSLSSESFNNFLKAIYGKQQLRDLNLSLNSINDTNSISDVLLSTPKLEFLDLSHNQLTQGSLLAPALSKLRKLRGLNLQDNPGFTTDDRVAIWNAISPFYPKSPFPLDEDVDYAKTYLRSLSSNITSLDLGGLIPQNSTVFEIVMPIVIERFPNLTSIDLSQNNLCLFDFNITADICDGIKTLLFQLPKLTRLQTLHLISTIGPTAGLGKNCRVCQEFSYTLGQLPGLQKLNFTGSNFLYPDFLGEGLQKSHKLKSVSFGGSWFTQTDNNYFFHGGAKLIEGLKSHPHLQNLDLSFNLMGMKGKNGSYPNATLALANALQSWPKLQILELDFNFLGFRAPQSASFFLKQLAEFAKLRKGNITVSLANDALAPDSIVWTDEAQNFADIVQAQIREKCEAEICSGKPLHPSLPINSTQGDGQGDESRAEHDDEEEKEAQDVAPRRKGFEEINTVRHGFKKGHQHKRRKASVRQVHQDEQRLPAAPAVPSEVLEFDPPASDHTVFSSTTGQLSVPSSAARLEPFFSPWVRYAASWFSPSAWCESFDRGLDRVAQAILAHAVDVVESCPSYFPKNPIILNSPFGGHPGISPYSATGVPLLTGPVCPALPGF